VDIHIPRWAFVVFNLMTASVSRARQLWVREGRNRSGAEAAMPGRLRGDERSARSSRTGIQRIATGGKIIATLAAIVTAGQVRALVPVRLTMLQIALS
jgi:hypothetical protein